MFRTPKTIEMQNTTLCLISLNNACCCSDSSFLIHQNPLSHYSVIFDFSFDCLPVQFSRCAEGSFCVPLSPMLTSSILQNDTVCKSTVKSYFLTSISIHQVWILCILRFVPLFSYIFVFTQMLDLGIRMPLSAFVSP